MLNMTNVAGMWQECGVESQCDTQLPSVDHPWGVDFMENSGVRPLVQGILVRRLRGGRQIPGVLNWTLVGVGVLSLPGILGSYSISVFPKQY